MTINKTKIKKLTKATVANSAISPLAFNAVRLNGFTAWESDGITTRNDIFETSTSGSDVWFAFFSKASDCRLILFDVISGWSSPQFTWACKNKKNIVIWTKIENQCEVKTSEKLTKWQSWWSTHPTIRTFIIISSPLFIPWNMTALKPNR